MLLLLAVVCAACAAWAGPAVVELPVDGVKRTALVYYGQDAARTPSPLVFVFHGLGGSAKEMARYAAVHERWPAATVVYPQGILVERKDAPPTTGWQYGPGRFGDRDFRFFDLLLDELQWTCQVDPKQIYACGHSNGGLFTLQLFVMRPRVFAAYATVSAAADIMRYATTPRPLLMIHGAKDDIVTPEQATATRDAVRKLNRCGDETMEWEPGYLTYTPTRTGMPVIWRLHPGGHEWPAEATEHIIAFFQQQTMRE